MWRPALIALLATAFVNGTPSLSSQPQSRFGLHAHLLMAPAANQRRRIELPVIRAEQTTGRRPWTIPLELYPLYGPQWKLQEPDPNAYDALLSSPWLLQRGNHHLLRMMADESGHLDEGKRPIARAVGLALYVWQNRGTDRLMHDSVIWLLRPRDAAMRDVTIGPLVSELLERFGPFIGMPEPSMDEVTVDLWLHTNASYNSAASVARILQVANQRGIRAVAIADYDTISGALEAVQEARRLKSEGKIAQDFSVIVGEQITSTDASILGLFLRERVLQGMTARATIEAIHAQGGLAFLLDPGNRNGVKLLKSLPFDGAVLGHGIHPLYRSLMMLDDPELADKIWLYASDARTAGSVGWNYSMVYTRDHTPEGIKQAMRDGDVCPCGNGYMPFIVLLGIPPVKALNRSAAQAQEFVERIESALEKALGADNVEIRVSWVRELQSAAGIVELPSVINRAYRGEGPLTRYPKVLALGISFGRFRLSFHEPSSSVFLQAAGRF